MSARTAGLASLGIIGLLALAMPAFAQTGSVTGSASAGATTSPIGKETCKVNGKVVPCDQALQPQALQSTCKVNGKEVPCEQLAKTAGAVVGWGLGFILFMLALGLAASVFWLMMLIHAATHPVQNRAMWIVLMIFTGILGAIIYWFAVKRTFGKTAPAMPMSADAGMASPIAPPVSPQLSEFVRNSRQQGVADDATRQSLIAAGWNAADVDRALKS